MGQYELDNLSIAAGDARRNTVKLANPLSDEQPLMRSTLLPGLVSAVNRNTSRGFSDVPLFEIASVSFAVASGSEVPRPSVLAKPDDSEITKLQALVPNQPTHIGAVITGAIQSSGWWGTSTTTTWRDAIELVLALAIELGIEVQVQAADVAPWHPGRCAIIKSGNSVIGLAGELSPRVTAATGLPARSVAFEINLDELIALANTTPTAPKIWTYPVAKEDIALVVPNNVAVGDLLTCIKEAAGELLEEVKLFDIYTGSPIPEGHQSLAFALRFRSAERTLSADEVASARTAAVLAATDKFGAVLRG
jgi:phenylalanyl-tRNA synthetase beta chain